MKTVDQVEQLRELAIEAVERLEDGLYGHMEVRKAIEKSAWLEELKQQLEDCSPADEMELP